MCWTPGRLRWRRANTSRAASLLTPRGLLLANHRPPCLALRSPEDSPRPIPRSVGRICHQQCDWGPLWPPWVPRGRTSLHQPFPPPSLPHSPQNPNRTPNRRVKPPVVVVVLERLWTSSIFVPKKWTSPDLLKSPQNHNKHSNKLRRIDHPK